VSLCYGGVETGFFPVFRRKGSGGEFGISGFLCGQRIQEGKVRNLSTNDNWGMRKRRMEGKNLTGSYPMGGLWEEFRKLRTRKLEAGFTFQKWFNNVTFVPGKGHLPVIDATRGLSFPLLIQEGSPQEKNRAGGTPSNEKQGGTARTG